MRVILRNDVPDIGKAGETVEVKDGYGRNYLIPRNLAIPATKANLRAIDEVTKQMEIRDRKSRREAEKVKDKLEKLSLSAEVLVGEEEKVFGSVTVHDIVDLVAAEGPHWDTGLRCELADQCSFKNSIKALLKA